MRREITGGLTWRSRVLLLLLPMVAVVAALSIGRVGVPVSYIFNSVLEKLGMQAAELMTQYESVLWKFRLPRILLSLLVGAGLSVSGCAFQSLFSNPLATPDTLGVASGTSFGAALALLLGFGMLGVQAMALCFGIAAVALTYLAGSGKGRSSMGMMILSGIMVGSLFTALISLIKFTADTESQLPVITYWLMGSMSAAGYDSLLLGAPLIVLGIMVLYLLRWRLNILPLSDDEARASGMNVKAMRIVTVLCATGITASCVSMCGQVGWVGFWCRTCAVCAMAAITWRWFRRRCAWGPPSWWRWTPWRAASRRQSFRFPFSRPSSARPFSSFSCGVRGVADVKLSVENGCFSYPRGGREVLKNINFSAQEGDMVAILGPNGAGKTTLLRCIMGFLRWNAGASLLDDRDIRDIPYRELWQTVAYVPQARGVASSSTALEMVLLGRGSRSGSSQSRAPQTSKRRSRPCGACTLSIWKASAAPRCRAASCRWCSSPGRWPPIRTSSFWTNPNQILISKISFWCSTPCRS